MHAVLKDLDHNDAENLDQFRPRDPQHFDLWLTAHIGSSTERGSDLFQIRVTTPSFLASQLVSERAVWGRHTLILEQYDLALIRKKITDFLAHCDGESWEAVAMKVSRIGAWEFEDYKS